jgi:hypothetical protein
MALFSHEVFGGNVVHELKLPTDGCVEEKASTAVPVLKLHIVKMPPEEEGSTRTPQVSRSATGAG